MKILYLISDFPKFSETFIRAEIQQLTDKGFEVEVLGLVPRFRSNNIFNVRYNSVNPLILIASNVYCLFTGNSSLFDKMVWTTMLHGIRKQPSSLLSWLYLYWSLDRITLRVKKSKPDMLFAHFMFRGAFVCSTVSDQLKIPYHLRVHTNYSNLLYSAQLRLIQNADSISTISRHTADYLETEFGLKNVPVIRQSLLIQNAPVEESQARQSETIRLIAAGRFVQKKGFHQLIHAVSLLELSSNQRIELNIYGEGPMLNRYLSDIKQLGLAEQCYVHPRISHSSLMKKIALSDLMVVPSIESKDDIDGIPTVIPEAMILGVPVIATDVGGISELIEDMNTGFLLKSQELSALASRISTAIEKREDWGRIVHNAKLKVLKEYELNLSDKLEPALISKHKKD